MGEPTVQQIFGSRLRLLREAQEYTQKEIAEILNVSRSTYTRYENGSSAPSLELLRRLAELLADGDPRFMMQLPTADGQIVADAPEEPEITVPALSPEERRLVLFSRTLTETERRELLDEFKKRSLERLAADTGLDEQ